MPNTISPVTAQPIITQEDAPTFPQNDAYDCQVDLGALCCLTGGASAMGACAVGCTLLRQPALATCGIPALGALATLAVVGFVSTVYIESRFTSESRTAPVTPESTPGSSPSHSPMNSPRTAVIGRD